MLKPRISRKSFTRKSKSVEKMFGFVRFEKTLTDRQLENRISGALEEGLLKIIC